MIEKSPPRPIATPLSIAQANEMIDIAATRGHAGMQPHDYVGGNSVDLRVNASTFVPSLVRDIENSKSLVDLRFFSWMPPGSGDQLALAIKKRLMEAHAGTKPPVEINAMVDKFGSKLYRSANRDFFDQLKRFGMNVVTTGDIGSKHDPLRYSADHGKLAAIDAKIAYGGGTNPAGVYDPWQDLMVRVEGPAAAQAQLEYVARLADSGQPISDAHRAVILDALVNPRTAGSGEVKWLSNTPGGPKHLTEHVVQQVANAKRVDLQTPYLGSSKIPNLLMDAEKRGAPVRFALPTPEGNEKKIYLNRTFYPEMIKGGTGVFEQPVMVHAKAIRTVDQKDVINDTIMSLNCNERSLNADHEVGVAIRDARFAQEMTAYYDKDFTASKQFLAGDVDGVGYKIGALARRVLQISH